MNILLKITRVRSETLGNAPSDLVYNLEQFLINTSIFNHASSRFNIKVGPQNAKGIHLRKGVLIKPEEFAVTVQPVYANDLDYGKSKLISICLNFNNNLKII